MIERSAECADVSPSVSRPVFHTVAIGISASALLALATAFDNRHDVSRVSVESGLLRIKSPEAPVSEQENETIPHTELWEQPDGPIELGSTIFVRVQDRMIPMTFSVDGKALSVGEGNFRQVSVTDGRVITVTSVRKENGLLSISGIGLLRGESTLDRQGLHDVAAGLIGGKSVEITTRVRFFGSFPVRIESASLPLVQLSSPTDDAAGDEPEQEPKQEQ